VGGLIHNLTAFADFYERASADIDCEEGVTKPRHIGNRDANAGVMQRDFRATVAIDRVRAYVLTKYGADLTIGTARRLLGDLIRQSAITVAAAEELPLEDAMDRLEAAESRRDDAGGVDTRGSRAGDEKKVVPSQALRTPAQLLEAFASAAARFPACPQVVAFLNSAREDGLVTVPSSCIPRTADGQPVLRQFHVGGTGKTVFGYNATLYGIGGVCMAPEDGGLNVGFVLYGPDDDEADAAFRELGNQAGVVAHVHDLVHGIGCYDRPLVLWSLIVFETLQGSAWLSRIDGVTETTALRFNPFAASVETLKRLIAHKECLEAERRSDPPPAVTTEPAPKRSTERGEGRAKLIAALTKHHRYADGSFLNLEPIGNNKLAKAAGVSPATASSFFNDKFQGHTKYKGLCRDAGNLTAALKLLNDEFAPYHLLGEASSDLASSEEEGADAE
jgi:hypothetical protein